MFTMCLSNLVILEIMWSSVASTCPSSKMSLSSSFTARCRFMPEPSSWQKASYCSLRLQVSSSRTSRPNLTLTSGEAPSLTAR
uniref:Putative secreted protein n=1 Tax=Ixodes ricinus TaxID=34613 RepID=A0A6B0U7Y2_IXORI